ncbi:MAG: KamA family radical SAM protein [Kiritimatiellae bacterium]|nr:KamA family radical SAM protein [Kiritimatiellia bacterium]
MDDDLIRQVEEKFPFVANEYAKNLAAKSIAFRKQMELDVRELDDEDDFSEDPFGEDGEANCCLGLKQRFPDRVLIMASNACFMNCRHCTRKGLLKHADVVRTDEELSDCLIYIREHPEVRDVLISGGDPLVLPDDEVMRFVDAVSSLEQVEVVRLCTRALSVNPSRITDELAKRLGQNQKVWVNTQFNCADELTQEAFDACQRLVSNGVLVSCQTVLLAGVNDSAEEMLKLFRALQRAKVRPYYVFVCDPIAGISHFRVPLEKAIAIEKECAEKIGGLGLPRFVADVPGSKRKVPISELD